MVPYPINELIRDHLFQQNAIIWLTQASVSPNGIVPVLSKQGYSTLAIGRLLTLPADIRRAVHEAGLVTQDSANPDFILIHKTDRKYLLVECKENSFGPSSTTAKQARALMIMAGKRAAEILGLDTSEVEASFLGYVLPEENAAQLSNTLGHLREEMSRVGLPCGQSSVLNLVVRNGEVCLLVEDTAASFLGLIDGVHPFMRFEPETDPRPFYFLPYQPGLNQSAKERNKCKFDLLKRLQQNVVVEVGQMRPPAQLCLEADSLLNRAYSGIYELWEDRNDRQHLRRLCNRFLNKLARALHSSVSQSMVQDNSRWKVTAENKDQHDRLMTTLTRFSPEATDLLEHMPQLPESYEEA